MTGDEREGARGTSQDGVGDLLDGFEADFAALAEEHEVGIPIIDVGEPAEIGGLKLGEVGTAGLEVKGRIGEEERDELEGADGSEGGVNEGRSAHEGMNDGGDDQGDAEIEGDLVHAHGRAETDVDLGDGLLEAVLEGVDRLGGGLHLMLKKLRRGILGLAAGGDQLQDHAKFVAVLLGCDANLRDGGVEGFVELFYDGGIADGGDEQGDRAESGLLRHLSASISDEVDNPMNEGQYTLAGKP